MTEDDIEDPNFNPMHIEDFFDEEQCKEKGEPELYNLAKSNFKQQNMSSWRPVPTLCYSVGIFLVITVISLAFGIPLLSIYSNPNL